MSPLDSFVYRLGDNHLLATLIIALGAVCVLGLALLIWVALQETRRIRAGSRLSAGVVVGKVSVPPHDVLPTFLDEIVPFKLSRRAEREWQLFVVDDRTEQLCVLSVEPDTFEDVDLYDRINRDAAGTIRVSS